jgi:hypothetical protein
MMGRRLVATIPMLACALFVAMPAHAAAGQSEKSTYKLGKCIVRADRLVAGQLLRSTPLTGGQTVLDAASLGKAGSCVKAPSLAVSPILLRGSLAQELFLRDFERFAVKPRVSAGLFARFQLPIDSAGAGADPRTVALYKLGDCVVRNEVLRIEILLRSAIGSGVERRLFDYLGPMMSACIGADSAIGVTRADLRSVFAQSAYDVSVRYWTDQLWTASAS